MTPSDPFAPVPPEKLPNPVSSWDGEYALEFAMSGGKFIIDVEMAGGLMKVRGDAIVRIPTIAAIDSDRNQPPVPIEASHLFRSKPAGYSDDPSRVAVCVASG